MPAIAFYTLGDSRAVPGFTGRIILPESTESRTSITFEEMYRARAISLVGAQHAFGVHTRAQAIAQLGGLPTGSVSAVYFIGHGYGNQGGGYFFSGVPEGADNFVANDANTLSFPISGTFLDALARCLDPAASTTVSFLSCYSGQPAFLDSLQQGLSDRGHTQIDVRGYVNYYNTRFDTDDGGHITGWRDRVLASSHTGGHDTSGSTLAEGTREHLGIPEFERHGTAVPASGLTEDPLGHIPTSATIEP